MSQQYDRGYYEAQAARNFQDTLDAAADASVAFAERTSTRRGEEMVPWSQYMELYRTLKAIAADADAIGAQRDEITAQRDLYMDTIRHFFGQVIDRDKANAYLAQLAHERGVPWRGPGAKS